MSENETMLGTIQLVLARSQTPIMVWERATTTSVHKDGDGRRPLSQLFYDSIPERNYILDNPVPCVINGEVDRNTEWPVGRQSGRKRDQLHFAVSG